MALLLEDLKMVNRRDINNAAEESSQKLSWLFEHNLKFTRQNFRTNPKNSRRKSS